MNQCERAAAEFFWGEKVWATIVTPFTHLLGPSVICALYRRLFQNKLLTWLTGAREGKNINFECISQYSEWVLSPFVNHNSRLLPIKPKQGGVYEIFLSMLIAWVNLWEPIWDKLFTNRSIALHTQLGGLLNCITQVQSEEWGSVDSKTVYEVHQSVGSCVYGLLKGIDLHA